MKKLAVFLSYAFHPLLMATYGCLILFFGLTDSIYFLFTPLRLKLILTLTIFSFTLLLPALNLLMLHKLNFVSSLKIEKRTERTFPYIMTSLCYFGLFYMIYDFNVWPALKLLILGGAVCILLTSVINLWWQISAHMMGIGGVIGILVAISHFLQIPMLTEISIAICIAGFIGFARLFLRSHTPSQVYVGFLFGFVLQFCLFFMAQTFIFL